MARKGLPKSIIKKYGITKKAWSVFRGRKGKKRSSKRKRSSNPVRRVKRRMGRRKKRRGGGGKSIRRTVFKFLPIAALVAPAAYTLAEKGLNENGIKHVMAKYTGIDHNGNFNASRLAEGWGPFVMTCLITKGVQKLNGIIRRL